MNQSLLKGEEIFADLSKSLNNAKKNIAVVSAWFTDNELLNILTLKQKEGVNVSVVIGDNKENEKLDFSQLISSGGYLKRIKGKGFGMMHQKYCVIDNSLGYHGSYNWSVNARKNNSESVIKTDHSETIDDLLLDFKNLTMEIEKQNNPPTTKDSFLSKLFKKIKNTTTSIDENHTDIPNQKENQANENISIDEVFKSIISAEAKKTDEESIKKRGYDLCKEVSGDHNVLTKSMNSLYHVYISDNAENVELKEKLIQKIEKKKEELIQLEEIERIKKQSANELYDITKQKELESEKLSLQSEIDLSDADVEINNKSIEVLKEKIRDIDEQVNNLELDFMKPSFNWFKFLPYVLFIVGLGAYLFLFYSSSLYIMIYSYQDAMELIRAGVPLADINPQVFESNAWSKAGEKGGMARVFIILFFFVPLVIAYISHIKNDLNEKRDKLDYVKMVSSYLVVFFIDAFIAAKVTTTIVEIKKEAKQIDPSFELTRSELISDYNFWLVFCLGALPFIFLSILIDKLSIFFKERSPEIETKRLKHKKKFLLGNKDSLNVQIDNLIKKNEYHLKEKIRIKSELNQNDKRLGYLPIEVNNLNVSSNTLIDRRIDFIMNKASLYLNDIDNDNISISFSTLNHRISSFIEGWNEWLHDEFATEKAILMSENAAKTVDNWLEEKKLSSNQN